MLVIFVDIRGFTQWSEANEVFINLDTFVSGFNGLLAKRFPEPDYEMQRRGDGALLLHRLPSTMRGKDTSTLLAKIMGLIKQTEADFRKHCLQFARDVGHETDLRLGWGVVRGKVIRMNDDWTGGNISKCARLCDEARPFGVVVDRDDFPELPKAANGLVEQVRIVRGIGEVRVWVSSEIATQFVPREIVRETPEVHVAGSCIEEDRPGHYRILVARRGNNRRLFPGKLEGCGGQLRFSESFADGVRRHYRQELGIDVEVLVDFHRFYEITEPNEPLIPGIRFLCRRLGDKQPASSNHSELIWMPEEEFYDARPEEFVGGLKDEVISLIEAYRADAFQRV
jgi:hypothetical protein